MRKLKIRLAILSCIIAGCSRTVDVSPPRSTDPSGTAPTSDLPSDTEQATPVESLNFDDNAIKN